MKTSQEAEKIAWSLGEAPFSSFWILRLSFSQTVASSNCFFWKLPTPQL